MVLDVEDLLAVRAADLDLLPVCSQIFKNVYIVPGPVTLCVGAPSGDLKEVLLNLPIERGLRNEADQVIA